MPKPRFWTFDRALQIVGVAAGVVGAYFAWATYHHDTAHAAPTQASVTPPWWVIALLILSALLLVTALVRKRAPATADMASQPDHVSTVIHLPNDVTAQHVVDENKRLQERVEVREKELREAATELRALSEEVTRQEKVIQTHGYSAEQWRKLMHDYRDFAGRVEAAYYDASDTLGRIEGVLDRIYDIPDGPISYDDALEARPLSAEDRIKRAQHEIYAYFERGRTGTHPEPTGMLHQVAKALSGTQPSKQLEPRDSEQK